ncbi:Retrovirus-related Pol polyprotein from type-1 retrotransposable element R2 [Frankliniella fusca]|uniref:Retrovirus-related Pol polyprotein from type-1 retrotransposable element R2 n=1 Tax=Frankliniella fusca TaxID=407009 RepID=A0AAE1HMS4_9NEOP|nr:Retrovirus-related Pol polyprotein from type-1 retrotransposable element R2 [Frankliniella fusca]
MKIPKAYVSGPITKTELVGALRKLRESAAGPDGVTRKDLRGMNQSDLLCLLNIVWGSKILCPILKTNRTVLLPKGGDLSNPKNWRPITIASRVLRLLQQIISARLKAQVPLHFSQRGFTAQDGVLMNSLVLQAVLKVFRANGRPLTVLSLDLAKAFDRVTTTSIIDSLRKHGVDEHTVAYINANYTGITTSFQCHGIQTKRVSLGRGTKQGDPMSGFLFNLIIDSLLEQLHEFPGISLENAEVKAMAFADDLILLANSPLQMSEMIESSLIFFNRHSLEVNVEKCYAYQLLRVPNTKRVCVVTEPKLSIYGLKVPTVSMDTQFKYLGHKYSHYGVMTSSVKKLDSALRRIMKAPLKPHQKLTMVQRYLVPSLYHGLQQIDITQGKLKTVTKKVRTAVKAIVHLPDGISGGALDIQGSFQLFHPRKMSG